MMFNRLQRHFDSFICNRNTIFPLVPTMVLFAYCDVISWSIFFSISPQQQQNRLLIKTTKSTKLRTTLSLSLSISLTAVNLLLCSPRANTCYLCILQLISHSLTNSSRSHNIIWQKKVLASE